MWSLLVIEKPINILKFTFHKQTQSDQLTNTKKVELSTKIRDGKNILDSNIVIV